MVMEKKWIKDLRENDFILAPTKDISDRICKKFDELGLKWSNGRSYIEVDYFLNSVDKINYIPFNGTFFFGDYEESICKVYTINDLLDFEGELQSDEGYTKEEIELLDKFAGLAMNGLVSKYGNEGTYPTLSQMSYEVAKEMLRARKEALKNG